MGRRFEEVLGGGACLGDLTFQWRCRAVVRGCAGGGAVAGEVNMASLDFMYLL